MRFLKIRRRSDYRSLSWEMTPLVDVVFNLLLFFMLTSHFVIQPGIKIRLPQAITSDVVGAEQMILVVTAHDLIFLEGKPATIRQLKDRLQDAASIDKPILIKADTQASLGRLVEIWDLCRKAGISQINIATTQR